jgi:hypothetical protein
MRARLALGAALAALLVIATAASAVPPTPDAPTSGPFTAFTLPIEATASGPPSAPFRASEAAPSAPPPATLVEPGAPPLPSLGARRQPAPKAGVVVKPTPRPKPRSTTVRVASSSGEVMRGSASWFCNRDASRARTSACHSRYPDTGGFNAYAAAGPRLRAAFGGGDRWRGRVVTVDGVSVRLVDWCQCYKGESREKVIDLYYDVFRRTGSTVTIRWEVDRSRGSP